MPQSRTSTLLFLAGTLSAAVGFAAECERSFVVAATGLWGDGDKDPIELQADRIWLQAVVNEAGFCLQVEERETMIARRLALMESGDVDLLVGASKTPDRERYAWFSQAYREESVLLFVRSNELRHYRHVRRFDDLLKLPVPWLAVRDNWMGPDYAKVRQELLQAERVYEFDAFPHGLAMLRYGRGELLLAPDTFSAFIQREKVRDVLPLPIVLHREVVHFMLSKASVNETEFRRFDEAIGRVRQQGGPTATALR